MQSSKQPSRCDASRRRSCKKAQIILIQQPLLGFYSGGAVFRSRNCSSFVIALAASTPVWRGRDRSPSAPYRRSSVAPRRSPGPLRRPQRAASRLCRGYRGNWPARFDAFGVLAVGFGLDLEGRTFLVLDAKSGERSTARQSASGNQSNW